MLSILILHFMAEAWSIFSFGELMTNFAEIHDLVT